MGLGLAISFDKHTIRITHQRSNKNTEEHKVLIGLESRHAKDDESSDGYDGMMTSNVKRM